MRAEGKRFLNQEAHEDSKHRMEDIEMSLIKDDLKKYCGIDDFQNLFQKKRAISEAIDEFHNKNKYSKQSIGKAQQRLIQIEHLAERAQKQGILLKNQMQKINEAHTMTKILTIEKMIKAKMENQELLRRKENIFRIRQQKHRASEANRSRRQYRTEKLRQLSMFESKNAKSYLNEQQYETIEEKRSKAQKIRSEKQRLKDRLQRYEQFKIEQGKRNYLEKASQLKQALEDREKKLDSLYKEELKEERAFQTTQNVTKQYLGSLFPTETI